MAHLWARTEGRMHKWLIYGHGWKMECINGSFMSTDGGRNVQMGYSKGFYGKNLKIRVF
ncbi:hypothetical protein ACFLSV_02660 [Bacteroidota bacterium]